MSITRDQLKVSYLTISEPLEYVIHSKYSKRLYKFVCECGNIVFRTKSVVFSGRVRSCGCMKGKLRRNGASLKRSVPEWHIWIGIKKRCYNKNAKHYDRYGGRGIKMDSRWESSFEYFYEDMGKRPSNQHSIERINNDLGYSADNCKWATRIEQANNKSNSVKINYLNKSLTVKQWSTKLVINASTIYGRIRRGERDPKILLGIHD